MSAWPLWEALLSKAGRNPGLKGVLMVDSERRCCGDLVGTGANEGTLIPEGSASRSGPEGGLGLGLCLRLVFSAVGI